MIIRVIMTLHTAFAGDLLSDCSKRACQLTHIRYDKSVSQALNDVASPIIKISPIESHMSELRFLVTSINVESGVKCAKTTIVMALFTNSRLPE